MPIVLAPDVVVEIEPPDVPILAVAPPTTSLVLTQIPEVPVIHPASPSASAVTVLPVAGPPGPSGPPGVSTNASCVWPVPVPVYLVQVQHNLGFYPAGVTAIDTSGFALEYAGVSYLSTSITEVTFDVPFSGTIYLS
jgi:hypothetical protein